jgi:hypothetical protein
VYFWSKPTALYHAEDAEDAQTQSDQKSTLTATRPLAGESLSLTTVVGGSIASVAHTLPPRATRLASVSGRTLLWRCW